MSSGNYQEQLTHITSLLTQSQEPCWQLKKDFGDRFGNVRKLELAQSKAQGCLKGAVTQIEETFAKSLPRILTLPSRKNQSRRNIDCLLGFLLKCQGKGTSKPIVPDTLKRRERVHTIITRPQPQSPTTWDLTDPVLPPLLKRKLLAGHLLCNPSLLMLDPNTSHSKLFPRSLKSTCS
jgi:hypothetical protein